MDRRYDPREIEAKWQRIWKERDAYRTPDESDRPKFYCLDFFPYPSGDGLSVGHCRNYVPTDVVARFYRMRGHNVLHPMGWDAFGLPAENYALKMGVHPRVTTARNIATYRRQMDMIGLSFDWSREITSSQPDYYRWTQWFFLLMHERGLAYRGTGQQWWCPSCRTILANEQVEQGRCWRCGTEVTKRDLEQWYFRITDYAQRLLDDLATIDWPEQIKLMQTNWIGRSEGAEVDFGLPGRDEPLTVFTTRPDTLFGATYMVLAPEHPLVDELTTAERRDAVRAYQDEARRQSEIERLSTEKEKTGVFTGAYAVNPVNGEKVPIWIADYVLMGYGTGAIMAVPAHDERDFQFATRFGLPIVEVIAPPSGPQGTLTEAYVGDGVMVNSGRFDGLAAPGGAFAAIVDWLAERGLARRKVNYKLRDWLISRQRYWGAPIPIVHCDTCGPVPVPADQLPVLLPDLEDFHPTADGRSPLARSEEFVHTTCPRCGGPGRRETDTMDTFVCSSWYHFRFTSPRLDSAAFDREKVKYWLPVDLYVGGAEHAVMHLLYARFFCKVLQDAGYVDFGEPYVRLRNQGMIQAEDGQKMSKSKGNVVVPTQILDKFGADAVRWRAAMARPGMDSPFDETQMKVGRRLAMKILNASKFVLDKHAPADPAAITEADDLAMLAGLAEVVRQATEAFEDYQYTDALEAAEKFFWTFCDDYLELVKERSYSDDAAAASAAAALQLGLNVQLRLFAPFMPFVTEEVWSWWQPGSVHRAPWPTLDELPAGGDPTLLDDVAEVLIAIRGAKSRAQVKMRTEVDRAVISGPAESLARLETIARDLRAVGRITGDLEFAAGADQISVEVVLAPQA